MKEAGWGLVASGAGWIYVWMYPACPPSLLLEMESVKNFKLKQAMSDTNGSQMYSLNCQLPGAV